jgi:hypothetical protein
MASAGNPVVTVKEAKHMKIPLFYGRTEGKEEISAEDLIDRIEALVKATGKGEDVAIQELYLALREDAVKWYKSLPMTGVDVTKWPEVKKQFLADYQFKIAGSVAYKLEVLRQKSNERVIDFFARVNEDFEHIMEEVSCKTSASSIETRTQIQKAIFIAGLRDELKSKILPDASARKTLMSVRKAAQTLEYVDLAKKKTANPVLAMKEMENEIDMIGNEEEADDECAEEEIAMINRYRAKIGKRPMRRRGGGRGGGTIRFTGKCFNCNLPGHRSLDCRQPKRNGVRSVDEEEEYRRENREENLSVISPLKNW